MAPCFVLPRAWLIDGSIGEGKDVCTQHFEQLVLLVLRLTQLLLQLCGGGGEMVHAIKCVSSSLLIRAATWSLFREVMSGSLVVISVTNAATSELSEGG